MTTINGGIVSEAKREVLVMYTEGGLCREKRGTRKTQGRRKGRECEWKRKFSSPFNFETNPAYVLSLLGSQFYFLLFPFPFALQRQGKKKKEKKKNRWKSKSEFLSLAP